MFSVFSYSYEKNIAIRSSNETVTALISYALEGLGWNVSNANADFSIDITDIDLSSSNGFTGTIKFNDLRSGQTIGAYNFNSASSDEIVISVLNLFTSIEQ